MIQIDLLTPFLSDRSVPQTIRSSHPEVGATLLNNKTLSLIVPASRKPRGTWITRPLPEESVAFIVPDIPATSRVFALNAFEFRPVHRQRVVGGIQVHPPRLDQNTVLLVTSNPQTIRRTARRIANARERAQTLLHWILEEEVRLYGDTYRQLARLFPAEEMGRPLSSLSSTNRLKIQMARENQQHNQLEQDRQTSQKLKRAKWKLWQAATTLLGPPSRQASLASFETLPEAIAWTQFAASANLGDNLLAESLGNLTAARQAGWNLSAAHKTQAETSFDILAPTATTSRAIHLRVRKKPTQTPPSNSPVLESPPIHLPAGELYVVQAEVLVKPFTASEQEALLIYDSTQGINLAHRVRATDEWEKLTLYRRSPPNGQFTILMTVEGSLEATIKKLAVRRLHANDSPEPYESDFFLANPQEQ